MPLHVRLGHGRADDERLLGELLQEQDFIVDAETEHSLAILLGEGVLIGGQFGEHYGDVLQTLALDEDIVLE